MKTLETLVNDLKKYLSENSNRMCQYCHIFNKSKSVLAINSIKNMMLEDSVEPIFERIQNSRQNILYRVSLRLVHMYFNPTFRSKSQKESLFLLIILFDLIRLKIYSL